MNKIRCAGAKEKRIIYFTVIIEIVLVIISILPFFRALNRYEYNGSKFIVTKAKYVENFKGENRDAITWMRQWLQRERIYLIIESKYPERV